MGENSKIDWCDHSFNPFWGCTKVSEACENCYAEAWAKRCGFDCFGKGKPRRVFGQKHWTDPIRWDRKAKALGLKHKVFAGSMCDVFDEEAPEGTRNALFGQILNTPNLIWILCTKRPQNIAPMTPSYWWDVGFPENIWMLVTAENQKRADERIPIVLQLPVKVRGVSIEPMLGPIDIRHLLPHPFNQEPSCPWCEDCIGPHPGFDGWKKTRKENHGPFLDWVIVSGESGPRPTHPDWVRKVRDDCRASGTAFFFKGWGEWVQYARVIGGAHAYAASNKGLIAMDERTLMERVPKKAAGRTLDGRTWDEFPKGE